MMLVIVHRHEQEEDADDMSGYEDELDVFSDTFL
mgnify:CR=1 FL=1